MRIINDHRGLTARDRGASVAIGNFDGVHLGHQAVIDRARCPSAPLGVLTFEPHPRSWFAPDGPPFRLMNSASRAARLRSLGVAILYEIEFDAALARLSEDAFVDQVLVRGIGATHAVVGADFRFGKGRGGDAGTLSRLGRELGLQVTIAPMLEGAEGAVSSSAIRKALSDGRPGDAAALLGDWHRITGPVVAGEQRGRQFGCPTANLEITGLHLPRFGIYAVRVSMDAGPFRGHHDGVANIGIRPMFDSSIPNLEVHLLDFEGDLYGTVISVALVEFLRDEANFPNVETLVKQMQHDCEMARKVLAAR